MTFLQTFSLSKINQEEEKEYMLGAGMVNFDSSRAGK